MENLYRYKHFNENIVSDYIKNKSIKLFNDSINISKRAFNIAKREGRESYLALKILNKMIKNKNVTDKEKEFFKAQAKDILKILPILFIQGVPGGTVAITPLLYKIEQKYNINIFPKSNEKILKDSFKYLKTFESYNS